MSARQRDLTPTVLTTVVLAIAAVLSVLLSHPARGEVLPERASLTSTVNVATTSSMTRATRAYDYAYAQRGDWYRYGATGPTKWDCSGLVMMSYKRAGVSLPRTTYDMLRDRGDKMYRTNHPRRGDLVFPSSGHVELYVKAGVMFGAHHSGTRVGYAKIYSGARGYPKYFHVR